MHLAISLPLFLIVFAGLSCFFVYMADIMFVSHDFATTKKAKRKLAEILKDLGLENSVLYDFGSARGGLAVGLSKIIPGLKITGIDSSKLRTLEAKIWSGMNSSKAKFVCADIKGFDVSKADVIYIYQNQINTDLLESKLKKELKDGAIVITNTQSFTGWEPKLNYVTHQNKEAYEKLFIYQKD
jgi:precorrin-6B methylase 2